MHTPLPWSLSYLTEHASFELTWPTTPLLLIQQAFRGAASCQAPCSARILSEHSLELGIYVSVSDGPSIGRSRESGTAYLLRLLGAMHAVPCK